VSEVPHLPIVSDSLFEAAQERFGTKIRATEARMPSATTCSRAWSSAARVTPRARCRARPARAIITSAREHRKEGKLVGTRIRKQIGELDRKIKAQVQALEKGIEPELVSERISELRGEKEALEEAIARIRTEREELKPRSCPNSWRGFPT
jgi:chromosome segregation ATPase